MKKREITLNFGTKEFKYVDLEHPNANEAFATYYQSMFEIPAIDMKSFESSSEAFFNTIEKEENKFLKHDLYFNNFTPVWLNLIQQRRFTEAEKIWKDALDIALRWERYRKLRIHKGTPYYFWAVTCFLNDDIDNGFWLMNQAYIEDKITHNTEEPDTPSRYFLHFETSQEQQFFRDKLLHIKDFLNQKLTDYSSSRNRPFDYNIFESKFLKDQQTIKDVKFHLNLNIFRLEKILRKTKPDEKNTIASLLYSEIIFDLCRVFEYLIKNQTRENFLEDVRDFSKKYNSNTLLNNFNFGSDFHTNNLINNLGKILGNTYTINNNLPTDLEKDILTAYGLRNFGAHKIEENKLIVNHFEEIVKNILNSIFLAIELR